MTDVASTITVTSLPSNIYSYDSAATCNISSMIAPFFPLYVYELEPTQSVNISYTDFYFCPLTDVVKSVEPIEIGLETSITNRNGLTWTQETKTITGTNTNNIGTYDLVFIS